MNLIFIPGGLLTCIGLLRSSPGRNSHRHARCFLSCRIRSRPKRSVSGLSVNKTLISAPVGICLIICRLVIVHDLVRTAEHFLK